MSVIEIDEEFGEDAMPTLCIHCKKWFDLTSGRESKLWYPNITICHSCREDEVDEIEKQEEIDRLKSEIDDACETIRTNTFILQMTYGIDPVELNLEPTY